MTPSALSQALRGIFVLEPHREAEVAATSKLIAELADAAYPLRLPLDDVEASKHLLNFVRANGVDPESVRVAIASVFGGGSERGFEAGPKCDAVCVACTVREPNYVEKAYG
jgi:hypothetical protein